MDRYDDCFADDESDTVIKSVRYFILENSDPKQPAPPTNDRRTYFRRAEENECVFDIEWAFRRRCSLSSLIYSRLQVRLGDKMKPFRG